MLSFDGVQKKMQNAHLSFIMFAGLPVRMKQLVSKWAYIRDWQSFSKICCRKPTLVETEQKQQTL
jgi:hypothetical protein